MLATVISRVNLQKLKFCLRITTIFLRNNYNSSWPSGLSNYFVCKRFGVQTLLWSLEFVIQTNLEHGTMAV